MASSSRNGNNELSKEPLAMLKREILPLVAKVGDQIVLEARSHFALVSSQLGELLEDVERLEISIDCLVTKMENLISK